ncbi:hypothetical protein SCALM49S_08480 [Streptomyces californicus]
MRHGPAIASDQYSLTAFVDAATRRIEAADTVSVLADCLVDRFDGRAALSGLLSAGSLPHAVVVSGKGVVDETLPTTSVCTRARAAMEQSAQPSTTLIC